MATIDATLQIVKEMLESACHFGHRISKWNPKMRQYIHGEKDNVHIIDLVKSYELLQKAKEYLKQEVAKGKTVLLVCTKLHAKKLIVETGIKTGMPYVALKWIPGILTNYKTIRQRIKYLKDLKEQEERGDFERYTKKEAINLKRIIEKLQERLGGVENMFKLPDIVFTADSIRDKNALLEAKRLNIPTVGIVDTNADPDLLTYPIPGNDDAIKSLIFFIKHIEDAILEGKKSAVPAEAKAV